MSAPTIKPEDTLLIVDSGRFCAAVIVREGVIIDAAPILRFTMRRSLEWLAEHCRKKGWKLIAGSGEER